MKKLISLSEHKVEFYDVDSMDVMWHGNYVKIIESARCAFLEKLGYTYMDMKRLGLAFPIVKMNFKYIAPAYFSDLLEVQTTLKEWEFFLEFSYEIRSLKTRKKIAIASTHQVPVRLNGGEVCLPMPQELLDAIKRYGERQ